ncbi:MAG: aminotransferase class I/II-fold pyridoxal phosphate-dependent enzyme [Planctomycetaceae bacterium]|nr:aminotransferase class I/II-fold pyridoxal phosphate-dependent enzyme [Planctomycetaceae bacterium]
MTQSYIDLRSDTVTLPTPAMLEAMMSAELGDDVMGEDPTVNRLEARMAEMFGKEAAVLGCSGTQSNQMAVWSHCTPGDELLIESTSHIGSFEAGAPAALSGVSVRTIQGDSGRLDLEQLEEALREPDEHFSPTRLLSLENSTNVGGGRTYPLDQLERVGTWAHKHGLKVHLDGARLFNACVVRGYSPADVGRCVDTVSICFSKGLGCPMGSVLVGDHETIHRARRARKLFGGALRQSGIIAGAALFALDHHIERLAEDHTHARQLAEGIAQIDGLSVDLEGVETNLVFFELDPEYGRSQVLQDRLHERRVRLYTLGRQRLRACTHLNLGRDDVIRAVDIMAEVVAELRGAVDGAVHNRYP